MKKIALLASASAVFATASMAAVDVSGVILDTAPVETIAVTMLGALGIIWVARQVINFLR
jgi:hypothetical protein